MIDLKLVHQNPEPMRKAIQFKKKNIDLDVLLSLDIKRKSLQQELDNLRFQQSQAAKEQKYEVAKELKGTISTLEAEYTIIIKDLDTLVLQLPNYISEDTPIGKDESENVVSKKVGEPRQFDFEPKDHEQLGIELGVIDKEKASQVTGSRFAYIKGDLVLLQNAIHQFTMSVLTNHNILQEIIDENNLHIKNTPFVPVLPPLMINENTMDKMGRLHPMDDRYCLTEDKLVLIGSAEHTLGPIHMDEVLPEESLPARYFAFTPAFRREAGSYGRDVNGILRMHQFEKIEMETFSTPETGLNEQKLIVAIQEYLIKKLGIPYQVIQVCSGDMGSMDFRQIDMECRIPTQGKYRETHTSDYMTDFQARRLSIKVQRNSGEKEFVHMNDATAFAMGRIMIAIMENFQEKDGSIAIPQVLHQYMMGKTKISKTE